MRRRVSQFRVSWRLTLGRTSCCLAGFDLSLTGFDEFELGELFAERTQGRTDPDDAPEPPAHPVAEPGDLWALGHHRLLCGDSTVATDVERELGGVAPHLMVTDPPYGVNYDPAWRNQQGPGPVCVHQNGPGHESATPAKTCSGVAFFRAGSRTHIPTAVPNTLESYGLRITILMAVSILSR